MQWSDEGIIISFKKHGENSAIIHMLTKAHGLHAGMINSITTHKVKAIYQAGNIVSATWKARLSEHIGSYNAEMLEAISNALLVDNLRLTALNSICSIIFFSLPEREPEEEIFEALYSLLHLLKNNDDSWLKSYVLLELLILVKTGFGLDLSECAATGQKNDLIYVSPRSAKAVSIIAGEPYKDKLLKLPEFFKHTEKQANIREIIEGLNLTGYFLERHNLMPRKVKMPYTRIKLKELISRIGAEVS
jgi:DNA repair protein RecO (recombination protein O)